MKKKISKIFIVPKRLLGVTDHLYTYEGHIECVGFTQKLHFKLQKKNYILKILEFQKMVDTFVPKTFNFEY